MFFHISGPQSTCGLVGLTPTVCSLQHPHRSIVLVQCSTRKKTALFLLDLKFSQTLSKAAKLSSPGSDFPSEAEQYYDYSIVGIHFLVPPLKK